MYAAGERREKTSRSPSFISRSTLHPSHVTARFTSDDPFTDEAAVEVAAAAAASSSIICFSTSMFLEVFFPGGMGGENTFQSSESVPYHTYVNNRAAKL